MPTDVLVFVLMVTLELPASSLLFRASKDASRGSVLGSRYSAAYIGDTVRK